MRCPESKGFSQGFEDRRPWFSSSLCFNCELEHVLGKPPLTHSVFSHWRIDSYGFWVKLFFNRLSDRIQNDSTKYVVDGRYVRLETIIVMCTFDFEWLNCALQPGSGLTEDRMRLIDHGLPSRNFSRGKNERGYSQRHFFRCLVRPSYSDTCRGHTLWMEDKRILYYTI